MSLISVDNNNSKIILFSFPVLLLLTFVICYQTSAYIFDRWMTSDYNYAFLLLPIIVYVAREQIESMDVLEIRPALWVVALLFAASLFWFVNMIMLIDYGQLLALAAISLLLFLLFFGWQTVWQFRFPVLLFLLALPLWTPLSLPLQDLTTAMSYKMLRAADIPAFLQHYYIEIPNGRFEIKDVCGGLRYFLVSLVTALMYGHWYLNTRAERLIVLTVFLLGAVMVNWLRVFLIIAAGHYWGMDHSLVSDHVGFGWVVYFIFLVLTIGGVVVWSRYQDGRKMQSDAGTQQLKSQLTPVRINTVNVRLLLVLASLSVIFFPAYYNLAKPVAETQYQLSASAYTAFPGLTSSNSAMWKPVNHGVSAELFGGRVLDSGYQAFFYAGVYLGQSDGHELINKTNSIADRNSWIVSGPSEYTISERKFTVKEQYIQMNSGARAMRVWYWYQVAGEATVSPLKAKLLELKNWFGRSEASYMLALAVESSDEQGDRERLQGLFQDLSLHQKVDVQQYLVQNGN